MGYASADVLFLYFFVLVVRPLSLLSQTQNLMDQIFRIGRCVVQLHEAFVHFAILQGTLPWQPILWPNLRIWPIPPSFVTQAFRKGLQPCSPWCRHAALVKQAKWQIIDKQLNTLIPCLIRRHTCFQRSQRSSFDENAFSTFL